MESPADRDFRERFEAAALRAEEWDHRALLRAAFLALRRHGWPEALRRVRRGIRHLDRVHGLRDGDPRGYHETLTLCWLRLLGEALERGGPAADFAGFAARHPEQLEPDRVLRHYSRERLASPRARREFVLPDRAPLPKAPARPAGLAAVRNGSARGKDATSPAADAHTRSVERPTPRRTPA